MRPEINRRILLKTGGKSGLRSEALATSPEFARKEYREYTLDHHGSRVVWHPHRIAGEPLLLHRTDLSELLPASASTRSLRRRGEDQNSRNQACPAHGEVHSVAALGFSIVKRRLDKNAYFHGGSRLVPKPYPTTSTTRFCPIPKLC